MASTGATFVTSGVNAGSGVAWANPTNIYTDNATVASCGVTAGQTSQILVGKGLGFSVPIGSTIVGIELILDATTTSSPAIIVNLTKDGSTKAGTSKTTPLPAGVRTYGSPSDLWGTSWTVAEVNSANFGGTFEIGNVISGTRTASVDYMKLNVYYIEPYVDQYNFSNNSTYYGYGVGFDIAQTFTAGTSGQLTQLKIQTSTVDNQLAQATIAIYDTTGGVPNNMLWSKSYTNLAQGWFTVDMDSGINIFSGQTYAIVLTSTDVAPGGDDNDWVGYSTGNPYAGGKFYYNTGSGWTEYSSGLSDACFETYVTPNNGNFLAFL